MIESYINEFKDVIANTVIDHKGEVIHERNEAFNKLADILERKHHSGGIIYLVGNGGSSGVISHSSIDFINACNMRAYPLTDNSILTCLANDYGYEKVFSRALETMFTENDSLIAVSSSGNSMNIRNASNVAAERGGMVLTFSGFSSDNGLRKLGEYNFWLDSSDYGKVEIGHALLLHILTDELSRRRNR